MVYEFAVAAIVRFFRRCKNIAVVEFQNDLIGLRLIVDHIVAITTDGDMDTGNEAIDIYCDFEMPTDPEVIEKLEKRMSSLYGGPMTMADIYLDGIVMAPDELCIVSEEVVL